MLFVLSTGRSGARTAANVLSQHPELVCLHEPEPRLIGETEAYRAGELAADDLVAMLRETRPEAFEGRRYAEAAGPLTLAVPALARAFPQARFLFLSRDGRRFVASGLRRGWYDPAVARDTPTERHRLRAPRLGEMTDDEWEAWSPFRRICWLWRRTNEIVRDDLVALAPHRHLHVRLEDLVERMDDVAAFLDLDPIDWAVPRLDTSVPTESWTEPQRDDFVVECGALMDAWYPGWDRATPIAEERETLAGDALDDLRVDVAELTRIRAELHLLADHTIRVDERAQRAEQRAEQLDATVAALRTRLASAQEGADEVAEATADLERRLATAHLEVEEAERRIEQIVASESFRLGHRLVRLLTLPRRVFRRLTGRPTGSWSTPRSRPRPASPPGPAASPPPVDDGFVDLDRLDPEVLDAGAIPAIRVTAPALRGDWARFDRALEALAPGGQARVVVPVGAEPGVVEELIDRLRSGNRPITVGESVAHFELEVGLAPAGSLESELITRGADTAAALVAARERVRRAEQTAAAEQRRLEDRVARLEDSTQYRLGAALVEAVRNPRRAHRVPGELAALRRRRRARARVAPAPTADAPPAPPRLGLRVGSVLDEFTNDCFAPEFELVPFDRQSWPAQLEGLGLVFVESAWRGNGATWNYTINKFEQRGDDLRALLDAARAAGVPSVFWNKEDPVSFDLFLPAARAFDVVLTTDAALVERYRDAVGHDRVAALPFAAQPRLHNPIGRNRGADVTPRVCFAGSWRGDKYAQRGSDFDTLLRPPLQRGVLDIYDRYAGTPDEEKLGFPMPFRSAVLGRLPYAAMNRAYRDYAAFLNVNSVQDSPTMFSRRVFELLACGTPVISTPARGIEELLGDTVLTTDTPERTRELVDWVVAEPTERDRHAHRGYRLVHREHTYEQRVDRILDLARVGVSRPRRRVSVVAVSNRPGQLDHVLDCYGRQTYPDRELVFVANSAGFDDGMLDAIRHRVPGAKVLRVDEAATLGECLNEALTVADGEYFAKFDDDDLYGDEYLADLMMTFPYSGAAVAGKQSYYAYLERQDRTVLRFPGNEFRRAPRVVGGTIVADRSQVDGITFEPVRRGTDSRFLEAVRARGLTVFSADRFNFCQVRHADVTAHTWAIDDDEFLRACLDVAPGRPGSDVFV